MVYFLRFLFASVNAYLTKLMKLWLAISSLRYTLSWQVWVFCHRFLSQFSMVKSVFLNYPPLRLGMNLKVVSLKQKSLFQSHWTFWHLRFLYFKLKTNINAAAGAVTAPLSSFIRCAAKNSFSNSLNFLTTQISVVKT